MRSFVAIASSPAHPVRAADAWAPRPPGACGSRLSAGPAGPAPLSYVSDDAVADDAGLAPPARRMSSPARTPARPDVPARPPAGDFDLSPEALGRALSRDERLARLAAHIRGIQQRYHPEAGVCPTGLPALDEALGGGLALGAVHELVSGGAAAPVLTLALRAALHAAGTHRYILAIDPHEELYPPALVQLGIPLRRLIVVHAWGSADTLWVAEQALQCRSVAAVVAPVRRLDTRAARRLQLAAEGGGGLGLLLGEGGRPRPQSDDPRSRLESHECERGRPHSPMTFAASRLLCEACPAPRGGGRRVRITVLKLRAGPLPPPLVVELPDATDVVPAPAVLRDGSAPGGRRAAGCG